MNRVCLILLILIVWLTACQSQTVTPAAALAQVTATDRPVTATLTAAVPSQTVTPSVEAVATATPAPPLNTFTPLPPTPSSLPTATVTATAPATATPAGTPTPRTPPELPTGHELLAPITWTAIGTALPPAGAPLSTANLDRLVEVGRWGKGAIRDAAYSPDGAFLYVLTEQGLYRYAADTAAQLDFWPRSDHPSRLAISPDGRLLAIAAGAYPYHVELRDTSSYAFAGAFFPFDGPAIVAGITFSGDGRYLFVRRGRLVRGGSEIDPVVVAWDVNRRQPVAELPARRNFSYAAGANLALTGSGDGILYLWRWQNEQFSAAGSIELPEVINEWAEWTGRATISPDGRYVAASGQVPNSLVAVWRVAEPDEPLYYVNTSRREAAVPASGAYRARPARISGEGRDFPYTIAFSPDSTLLAVATGYYDLTIWQAADGAVVQELVEVGDSIHFTPDSRRVATGRQTLSQWEIAGGAYVNVLNQHIGAITDLALIPGRNQLAIASLDRFIYLRQFTTGGLFASLRAGISNETYFASPAVFDIDVSADGRTLVSASNDAYRVWDLDSYQMTELFPRPRSDIGAGNIAVSADGQWIVGREYDIEARVWHWDGAAYNGGIQTELYSEGPIVFAPIADFLAVDNSFFDGDLILLRPDDGASFRLPLAPGAPGIRVQDLVFSADGRFLAGCTASDEILVWAIAPDMTGTLLFTHEIAAANAFESVVAFAVDGQFVAQSADSFVRFWQMPDGVYLGTLDMGVRVNALEFSPDGGYLISGHDDGSVRFWAVP